MDSPFNCIITYKGFRIESLRDDALAEASDYCERTLNDVAAGRYTEETQRDVISKAAELILDELTKRAGKEGVSSNG